MSSIYKKGRDGYYYYQAYVYNPKTDKKDKRVFHALKTKNINEAKEKQKVFDIKYEGEKLENFSISSINNSNLFLIPSIIGILILFTTFYNSNDRN